MLDALQNEIEFNKLPLADRVALTRDFIRDVTVLSRRSDGLVMSASSNVGRLMALLCGEEKALRHGRVRSVDTRCAPFHSLAYSISPPNVSYLRWFPTARFQ